MHASQVSSAAAYQPVYSQRKSRGTDEAAPAQAVERRGESHRHHRSERAERSDDSRTARNPLVNAMMEALKGLTQGAGNATDAASAEAPAASPKKDVSTAAAKTGDSPKSVKEAALNFANELYSALRAAGESSGAAAPRKTGYGDSGGGYGDLAQGLKRLAQSVAAPPKTDGAAPAATSTTPVSAPAPKPVSAPATAPAPASTAAPAVSRPVAAAPAPKPVAANPETPKPSAPAPAVAPAAATSASRSPITINITFNFVNSTAIGTSKASPTRSAADADESADSTEPQTDSPLLKAFKDLMAVLNGDSAEGGAAIDNDKAVQILQGFLQKIAESLGGDATAETPEAALPPKGSLISVTA